MTPLTTVFLALACSIFGTTSELASNDNPNTEDLFKEDHIHRTDPRHFYNRLSLNTKMRHFNIESRSTKEVKYLSNGMRQFNVEARETDMARRPHTVEQFPVADHGEISRRISQRYAMRQFEKKSRARAIQGLSQPKHLNKQFNVKAKGKNRQSNVTHIINRKRRQVENPCDPFTFKGKTSDSVILYPPRDNLSDKNYSSNITCITTIDAGSGHIVVLSFINEFHMEGDMPTCENDYLEIREGKFGYGTPKYKYCGLKSDMLEKGSSIVSSSQYMWLKFQSDDSVEYEGFQIKVEYEQDSYSDGILDLCMRDVRDLTSGEIGSHDDDVEDCRKETKGSLDIQWRIETAPGTSIFLNFTEYKMAKPNDCENNLLQVFGSEPDFDHNLANYCGSVSMPVTTILEKEGFGPSNVMYIRLYATKLALDTKFKAQFTAFRTLEGAEQCNDDEFDCTDGTCIDKNLYCDHNVANCRLKTDEQCDEEDKSIAKEPRILIMLGIFSVVLFAVGAFFLFTCIRKLYRDHQYIKETLQAKSQDRLDQMSDGEFSLDTDRLARDTEPRATLERENFANEMNQRKSGSYDSNFLHPDSPHNLDDDWPESNPILSEGRKEYNGKFKRNDTINKEDSPRIVVSNGEELKENEHQGRNKRKDSSRTHRSLRTEKSIEDVDETKYKGKPKRNIASKKESLKPQNSIQEEQNEMEHNDRLKRSDSSKKDKLSRSQASTLDEPKDYQGKLRRNDTSNGDSQGNTTPKENYKQRERHKPKRDTSKQEEILTPKTSKDKNNETEPSRNQIKNKDSSGSKGQWSENKEIENKGKLRRDTSKKEESLRMKKAKEESKDVSVGTMDTKEFGCQTRDSLFLLDPVLSSDGTNSSSNSRGLSVFGCSSATIARPAANTSQITIDLQASPPDPVNIHMDHRPMSSETTRSAPDVIIVAKPTAL